MYYRLKLGSEGSAKKFESAKLFGDYLSHQSVGAGMARNYDAQGNQIRGWHRRSYHPAPPQRNSHPLLDKYSR